MTGDDGRCPRPGSEQLWIVPGGSEGCFAHHWKLGHLVQPNARPTFFELRNLVCVLICNP